MTKTLFDAVVGTPPPSTVDVTAIVRRRRRLRAVRRLGIALAPVAVAGLTAAVLLGTVGGTSGPSPSTAELPAATTPATTPAPALTAEQLRAALAGAVAALAPDARWLPDGEAPLLEAPAPARTEGTAVVACNALRCLVGGTDSPPADDVSFSGRADLQRGTNTGLVMVAAHTTLSMLTCDGQFEECTPTTSPQGSAMVIRAIRPSALPDGMSGPIPVTTRLVAIELPGGQLLEVGVNGPKDANVPPDMVFTEAELVALADDIARRVGA